MTKLTGVSGIHRWTEFTFHVQQANPLRGWGIGGLEGGRENSVRLFPSHFQADRCAWR